MNPSIDLSPHRPEIEAGQIDDLRRRLFGGAAEPSVPGYTIEHELGRGAFGRVYRAFDPRFARVVALKVVPVRSPSARLRVEREAHALARLSHPNVVQVYDKGPAGPGAYFLALEFVEGPTLAQWLRPRPRSVSEVLTKFLDVARGLAAAHDAGLIHRDFKPANAIVGTDGRVRVLDFGLARALTTSAELVETSEDPAESAAGTDPRWQTVEPSARTGEDPTGPHAAAEPVGPRAYEPGAPPPERADQLAQRLTAAGNFVGTPHYASPEQYEGQADARSDQFAFFVALYEALYRRLPYPLRRGGPSWARFIDARVDFRGGRRRVPAWLVRAMRRGLDVEPARRHADMTAVAALLQHRLHRHPGRMRTAKLAGAAALVSAAMVSGLSVSNTSDDERCRDQRSAWPTPWVEHGEAVRARDPRLAASLDAYASDWQHASQAACHVESPEARAEVDACLLEGSARLGQLTGWLAARGHDATGATALHAGPRPLAGLTATLPSPTRCLTGEEPRASAAHGEAWRALLASHVELGEGALGRASTATTAATDLARELGDRSLLVAAQAQQLRLDARRGEPGDLVAVVSLVVQALDAGQRSLAADIAATSMSLVVDGALPSVAEDLLTAAPEDIHRLADELAAMRRAETPHATDSGVTGWLRYLEGHVLRLLGDAAGARAQYHQAAVELTRAEPPLRPHQLALIELNEAISMGLQRPAVPSARSLAERALRARRAGLGPDHPSIGMETQRVGELYVHLEDFEGALRHYEDAERIFIANEMPLERTFVQGEIVYAHWLAARLARARALEAETNGDDPAPHWALFERERHLALQHTLRLEQQLPPALLGSSSDAKLARPRQQARLWVVVMRSYLYHRGCFTEAMAAGHRLDQTCLQLSGADAACVDGRRTLHAMLERGLASTPTQKECAADPARIDSNERTKSTGR